MNAELMKIRKNNQLDEKMTGNITKYNPDVLIEKIKMLNTNMAYLYTINNKTNIKINIDEYIDKIISNIYLILDMFNDMGVYPDYFYNIIVKMNIEYQNLLSEGKIRGDYGLYQIANFSARMSQMIRDGLNSGKYQMDSANSKDISECFLEMVSFFQRYNIPHNIKTSEMCRSVFNDIYYNTNNIINNTLMNSDFIYVDIECMSRLLFEYISFFAAIGINPKTYLDNYIEKESQKGKGK